MIGQDGQVGKDGKVGRAAVGIMACALCALAAGAAACGKDGRSLLPVDVSADKDVTSVAAVDIDVLVRGAPYVTRRFEWTPGGTLSVGIYLGSDIKGEVSVKARGLDMAEDRVAESAPATTTVTPGKTAPGVTLVLKPVARAAGDAGARDGGSDVAGDAASGPDGQVTGDRPPPDGARQDAGVEAPPPDVASDISPDAPAGPAWQPGENIEKDPVSRSYSPDVAVDPRGNAVLAWEEGGTAIRVRRYEAATGRWGEIKTIENRGGPELPQVGLDAAGNAIVVWYQDGNVTDPALRGVWSSESADGVVWTPPTRIRAGVVYYDLVLAMSRGGTARVVWQESASGQTSLWTAYYDGARWGAGVSLKDPVDTSEFYPRMALDATGGGLLTFMKRDMPGGQDSVWASVLMGASARAPTVIESYTTDNCEEADVAVSETGRGLAAWMQRNGTSNADLWVSEYLPANGWRAPQKLLTADWISAPAVAVDRTGVATVAWTQPISTGRYHVFAARSSATGWTSPVLLEAIPPTALNSNYAEGYTNEDPAPRLGVDAQGNVHAVWRKRTAPVQALRGDRTMQRTFSVWASRYSAVAMKWSAEVMLAGRPMAEADEPQLAVAENGVAVAAIWFYQLMFVDPDAYNVLVAIHR